ncbi:pentatricopeptide repeat-containing protein At4g15720-like isoform X2 [Euphorbia lathyris]|uniref:pentatricopeptide repeat-containing protein At4g15720-like isoform X2 n=1 Tax=Euphorbia lathyris TaxID=212925 RepID=UPI0033133309
MRHWTGKTKQTSIGKRLLSSTAFHLSRQNRNSINFTSATSTHASLLKCGLLLDNFTTNNLINSYIKLQLTSHAHILFDEMPEPDVVSWTSLIAGYVHADLQTGKKIHTHVEILGFQQNLVLCSSLVHMYGKCNDVDGARRVFDSMEFRNVVSWTSIITAYAQNGRGNEALEVFREFTCLTAERPNHYMLASLINACSTLGKLISGKVAHGAVIRGGHESNDVAATALVDMYAKCGCFGYSDKVFKRIPHLSVIPYTSMIVAAAKYGLGQRSLDLFEEMIHKGIKPNHVTFLGVLHACSHSGLVDEGLKHLNSMSSRHGVTPLTKHYTCVVDMLSRIGRLDEAYSLAKSINVNPNEGALLWGTLLSASRLQGRVDIAVEASKRLIESNQQVAGAYVTLSNTYALAGEWDNAQTLRSEMKQIGVYKEPGCSWVEIKDSTYVFYAGDLSCERGEEVLSLLKELERRMKEKGYVGGSKGLVFIDVEEEAKEEIVSLHSERIALAFGLIGIPKGIRIIRVMKNLRMCKDCHEAFKLISEIVEREFVVRDINRFHHFKDGFCSCKDFW